MQIDKEDEIFWQETMKGVKAVKSSENNIAKVFPKKIKIHQHEQYAVKQDFTSYSKDIEDNEFGGIDKSTLRKFKREEFPVEAALDLHGLNENDAFIKVDDFIPRCYNQGKRCIMIITGKGYHHQENEDIFEQRGILKKLVPQWLNMARLRGLILIYKHPSERLGGQGAIYLLLRRKR